MTQLYKLGQINSMIPHFSELQPDFSTSIKLKDIVHLMDDRLRGLTVVFYLLYKYLLLAVSLSLTEPGWDIAERGTNGLGSWEIAGFSLIH